MARRHHAITALGLGVLVVFGAGTAGAQTNTAPETRAEELRAERAAKAQSLAPHQQNSLERGMHFFEDRAIFILDREGFYPKLGSLTVGSGFGIGRRRLLSVS